MTRRLPDRGRRHSITVVGLGPSGKELVPERGLEALRANPSARRFCRTFRHPAVRELIAEGLEFRSFDDVYDSARSMEEVYKDIADRLIAETRDGEVVYAVPGSPFVGERSVLLLRDVAAAAQIDLEVIPGISFIDAVVAIAGVDPVGDGLTVLDAEAITDEQVTDGPLLVAQCHSRLVVSDLKVSLLEVFDPDHQVLIISDACGSEEQIERCNLSELDRSEHSFFERTSIYVPKKERTRTKSLMAFVDLVETLRGPGGCPWDARQTHQSLSRHLLEETYEVLEVIEDLGPQAPEGECNADAYARLEEELGDLLFQVAFHATLAKEAGAFTFADVAEGIHQKLVRRHPHVFGDLEIDDPEAVVSNWEKIKTSEKRRESLMDDLPKILPALARAGKMQRRAASIGFDWSGVEPVVAKVREELEELEAVIGESDDAPSSSEVYCELGDLLFATVNLARKLNIDPEASLRSSSERFAERFRILEHLASERSIELGSVSIDKLDALWEEAKRMLARSVETGP